MSTNYSDYNSNKINTSKIINIHLIIKYSLLLPNDNNRLVVVRRPDDHLKTDGPFNPQRIIKKHSSLYTQLVKEIMIQKRKGTNK